MNLTLEQVKEDIASGKSTMIYYSIGSAWWTHLGSDLQSACEAGKIAREKGFQLKYQSLNSEAERKAFGDAYEKVKNSDIPTDPTGCPLFQTDEVLKFITMAEGSPDHYGRHKLDAFMKAHHQNCEGLCSVSWSPYNDLIDNEEKTGGLNNHKEKMEKLKQRLEND